MLEGRVEHETRPEKRHDVQSAVTEISVTCAVFTFDGSRLRVMGLKNSDMNSNQLALPRYQFEGGMSLQDAANLAIKKSSDVKIDRLFQVGAFTQPRAGEENSSLDICFMGVTPRNPEMFAASQEGETSQMEWVDVESLSEFDEPSQEFIRSSVQELRKRARFEDIAFALLPQEFSLSELQKMFEAVMGRNIDVRNFRKKIDSLDILVESPHKPKGVAHRPPRLYSFSDERFRNRVASEGEIRFF